MKRKVLSFLFFSLAIEFGSYAQYGLQLYNNAIITMSGATSGSPLFINVNQSATTGIYVSGGGVITSENQYHFINWQTAAATGAYVFPFGEDGNTAHAISLTLTKSAGNGDIAVSTKGWGNGAAGINVKVNANNTDGSGNYFAPLTTASQMQGVWGGDASTATIDRWWDIFAPAGTTASSMTFSYMGDENTTTLNPTGNFQAQQWVTGAGGAWQTPVAGTAAGGTTSGTIYSLTTTAAVSTFPTTKGTAPWVLSSASHPLPIQLIEFSGRCNNGVITLTWSTASETNNDHFNVERSSNGTDFETIQEIKGAGTSSSLIKYQTADNNTTGAPLYYRLKQTDYDGKYTYSNIIVASCNGGSIGNGDGSNGGELTVFPNPSSGENLFVKFANLPSEEKVLVVLVDVLGQTVYSKVTFSDTNGGVLEAIDGANHLAAGVYTVVGSAKDQIFNQKIIIR